jgi:hypothetical protein
MRVKVIEWSPQHRRGVDLQKCLAQLVLLLHEADLHPSDALLLALEGTPE